jgi:hypothetical protein
MPIGNSSTCILWRICLWLDTATSQPAAAAMPCALAGRCSKAQRPLLGSAPLHCCQVDGHRSAARHCSTSLGPWPERRCAKARWPWPALLLLGSAPFACPQQPCTHSSLSPLLLPPRAQACTSQLLTWLLCACVCTVYAQTPGMSFEGLLSSPRHVYAAWCSPPNETIGTCGATCASALTQAAQSC